MVAKLAVILEAIGEAFTSPRDSTMILPQFMVSIVAISSIRSLSRLATRCKARDRSSGVNRAHGPSSKAVPAAPIARSASSAPARGTRPIVWFDAGLTVSKVLPLALDADCPPISRE